MQKKVIATFIIASTLLAGCVKTQSSSISFDTFWTTIKSPYQYQQTKISSDTKEIQKVYTTTASGVLWSIIIANQPVLSGDSISFANENLKALRTNIAWRWNITDTENVELSCGDDDILGSMSTIEVKKDAITRYVTQLYFVYEHKWYIVSHLTENKDEVKWIQKSFSKINCPKN